MRALGELQRAISLDDLATVGHRLQLNRRLQPFRAERSLALVGGGEQRQRRLAEPANFPQPLTPVRSERMERIGFGEPLDRGAGYPRSPPDLLDRL